MNPYEPPHTADEQAKDLHGRKKLVAFALILAVVLIVGGVVTFLWVKLERATAIQYEAMLRAEQAEAEAMRTLEAAKAASQSNPSAP